MENFGITNEGFVAGMSVLAAAIAVLPGIGVGIGQGRAAASAAEAVGRQPEAKSDIQGVMIIGIALAETAAIYGLLVAIIILFVQPFSNLLG